MISIIIPVYNVEDYLNECLDSIVNQSYNDCEIIIIDDGSTDGSLFICKEYEKKDTRIKVLHKENGGVSSARNLGLDIAKGDWIWFVDADDWIKPDALSILDYYINKFDSDMIFHGLVRVDKSGKRIEDHPIEDFRSSADSFLEKHYCCQNGMLLFNGKIIRQNNIRYTEGIVMGEDLEFQYKYLLYCKYPISIAYNLYYYRYREGSAISNKNSLINNMKNNFHNSFSLLFYANNSGLEIKHWMCIRIKRLVKSAIQSGAKLGHNERKEARQNLISLRKYIKQYHIKGIYDLTLYIALINMDLYSWLLNVYLNLNKKTCEETFNNNPNV